MKRRVDAIGRGAALLILLALVSRGDAQAPEKPSPFQYLEGHAAGVYAVAYSPDGKTILSASLDGTVKVWDRETGQLIRTVADSREALLTLAVTKSGLEFAAAGLDGRIRVYDLPSHHPLAVMTGVPGVPTSIAVSDDGKLVVTGDQSRYVRLWNPQNNQPVRDFGGSTEAVTAVALAPEIRTVLAAAKDGSLRGWNLDNAQSTGTVLTAPLNALAMAGDGKTIAAVGQDGLLRRIAWPPAAPQSLVTHGDQIGAVALSDDAEWLASGGFDQQVHLFQASDGKRVRSLSGQSGKVTSLAFDPASKLLASASDTGLLKFWQVEDGADRFTLAGHTGPITAVAFHPAQEQVASAGQDGTVRIWQLPVAARTLAGHGAALQAVAVSSDGTLAATASADKSVRIWNMAEGKSVRAITRLPQPATKVAFSSDAKQLAIGDTAGGIRIETVAEGGEPTLLGAHTAAISGLAFVPDGKTLVSTAADGTLKSWTLPATPAQTLTAHAQPVVGAAVSRDGKIAVTAGRDGIVRVHDLATGKERRQWKLPAAPAVSLSLSPDASLVAVGDATGRVRFWKTEDGSELAGIGGHTGEVHAVAFDDAQQQVATTGADGTARIWRIPDVSTPLAAHQKPVQAVAVATDGKRAVTVGADGLAQVWSLAEAKPQQAAKGESPLHSVAIRKDGAEFATGDAEGTVRLVNAETGEALGSVLAHEGTVTGIAYHPQQPVLATSGSDGTVKLWQLPFGATEPTGRHDGGVAAIVTSSDGQFTVTGGADRVLRLRNRSGEKQLGDALPAAVRCLALGPGNAFIVVGTEKGTALVVGIADGAVRTTIDAHQGPVAGVAVHPSGNQLATTGTDGKLRLWETAGKDLRTVDASKMPLCGVIYTPDGNGVLTAGADKSVQLWNPADGKLIRGYAGTTNAVTAIALSRDGSKIAAACADKTIHVWKLADGAAVTKLTDTAAVRSLTLNAAGTRLAAGLDDGRVTLWDLGTSRPLQRFRVHQKVVNAVTFAHDEQSLLSASVDGTAQRAPIAAKLIIPAHEGGTAGVIFTNDGKHVLSGGADKFVRLFDLTGKPVRQFQGCTGVIRCLALRGDGAQVAAGSDDQHVALWRFDNAQLERRIPTPAVVQSLSYSADHTRLAAGGADNTIRLFAPADGRLLEEITRTAPAVACAFLPDSQSLLTVGAANAAIVQPVSLVQVLAAHQGAVTAAAWTPNGNGLLTGGADKTIIHWNLKTGQPLRTIGGHQDAVTGLAVTADGATVVSGSADRTLRTWTLANGAAVANIAQPTPVRRLAFDAKTRRVATVGDDALVRVWDLASGRELQQFTGHTGAATAIAMGADGRQVVSGGADKSVRFWNVAAERVVVADPTKVNDLALLPDGSQMLTAGDDKLVKLWDREGKLVRQFGGSPTAVRSVAVSADGTRVAAGGDPQFTQPNVFLWTLATGAAERTLTTPAAVSALAFNADARLAVAGADKHLRIYRNADGRLLEDVTAAVVLGDLAYAGNKGTLVASGTDANGYVFQSALLRLIGGHEGAVTGVAWASDGERLVTAGADKTVRLWNAADGEPLAVFAENTAPIVAMRVLDDGSTVLAAASDNTVRAWAIPGQDVPKSIPPARTLKLLATVRALAGNAQRLVVAGDDGLVRVIDRTTGIELERLAGHNGAVHSTAISSDSRLIVSGGTDRIARRWVPAVTAAVVAHQGPALAVCFSPAEDRLFTAGEAGAVREWNAETFDQVGEFEETKGPVRALAVSADGGTLAAGDETHLRLWKTENREPLAEVELPGAVASLALGPDGRKVVVATTDQIMRNFGLADIDGTASLVLTQEGHGHTGPVTAVALAGDGRTLFTAAKDQTVRRWSAAAWHPRHAVDAHRGAVYDLEYSPDDQRLASAGADGTVQLRNAATGALLLMSDGEKNPSNAVAFDPTGKELASAGADGHVRIWNVDVPKPDPDAPPPNGEDAPVAQPVRAALLAEIAPERAEPLVALLYSRDGKQIFAGGADKAWHVWARADQTLVRSVVGHNQIVYSIGYNPAGNRLATLDLSAKLFIWNPADGGMIFHQQLPAATAWSMAHSPDGQEIVVGTADARVLRVTLPPQAR